MLRQRLEVCRARAAWIELRLDRVEDSTAALVAKLKKLREDYPEFRWVAACRFASQESEQIRLLEAAGEAGVDFVDQPLELQQSLTLPPQVHRIHSWHQEGPGGEAPARILQSLLARAAEEDWCKIVTWAEHAEDAWPTLGLYRSASKPLLAFAQGPGGTASRLLSLRAGAPWIYCSWPGEATAPGQGSLLDMEAALPADLQPQTPVLGVVGQPVDHSLSPFLWQQAHRDLEGAPSFLYLKFPVADLPRFLAGAARHGVTALSITAPHKQEAQQLACTSTEVAAACQAANLLMLQASTDGWSAAHTDGQGALDALQNRGLQDASSILLIGAGGAAHAVAAEAIARGHAVTLTSRRQPNPPWPGTLWQSFEEVHPAAFDAVIQATPVGSLHTPGHLLAGQPPRAGALALDMVYHPPVTAWMLTAQSAGADVLPGTSMLVHQMVAQHRLVLPALPAPCAQSLETALQTHLQDRAPIVLVGLPASGKSTLGQALAQTLGRTFLDADVVLAQRHGTTLAAWIASDEAAFRQAEADLLRELLATPHAVIATGGGVVERPESVRLLKDAAGVVYLDCPTDVLLERQRLTPRPRLRPGTLEQELQSLLEQREPSYRDVANLVISTNEKASSGVMEILRGFGLKGIAKGFR